MEQEISSLKKTAQLAGLIYLIFAVIAFVTLMVIPNQFYVSGDAAASLQNISDKHFLFRISIAGSLASQALFIFLVFILFKLFREVNINLARLMAGLVIVAVAADLALDVLNITALMAIKGELLGSFDPSQEQDLIMLLLKAESYGTELIQAYWGLWLLPFGLLVYKSGFIPRILGVFLLLNGVAYVLLSLVFLFLPGYQTTAFYISLPFLILGEFPIMFWLLIKGVSRNSQ